MHEAPSDEREHGSPTPIPEGYARYAGLGIQFAMTIVVLGALGYWADHHFGTTPWLMIAGILLGSVGGFVSLVHQVPASRPRSTHPDRSEPS